MEQSMICWHLCVSLKDERRVVERSMSIGGRPTCSLHFVDIIDVMAGINSKTLPDRSNAYGMETITDKINVQRQLQNGVWVQVFLLLIIASASRQHQWSGWTGCGLAIHQIYFQIQTQSLLSDTERTIRYWRTGAWISCSGPLKGNKKLMNLLVAGSPPHRTLRTF